LGAEPVLAVATSAMRDAANAPQFRDSLHERYGIELQTISGDEEARLTFLGATAARPAGGSPTLVIDIGGGSTEFTVGTPGSAPEFAVSTRAGSVRQTERHLRDDPPTHSQTEALAAEIRSILAAEVPERVRTRVSHGIAVAGTATSLAAISQELDPYDAARVHGYRLERAEAERITALLATLPLSDREEVPGLHPKRAPTIVAGAVILVESMRAFELQNVDVSEADILHGTVLDVAS
ncbi:MAG: Ppx/GppA family phosphatase, partial [Thermoleophilaceae bacterium]|nr:Ppx/GppA family phosphatase [Thermoleophilaceae bacterium]